MASFPLVVRSTLLCISLMFSLTSPHASLSLLFYSSFLFSPPLSLLFFGLFVWVGFFVCMCLISGGFQGTETFSGCFSPLHLHLLLPSLPNSFSQISFFFTSYLFRYILCSSGILHQRTRAFTSAETATAHPAQSACS